MKNTVLFLCIITINSLNYSYDSDYSFDRDTMSSYSRPDDFLLPDSLSPSSNSYYESYGFSPSRNNDKEKDNEEQNNDQNDSCSN